MPSMFDKLGDEIPLRSVVTAKRHGFRASKPLRARDASCKVGQRSGPAS